MTWFKAALDGEIGVGECRGVTLGGEQVALFNVAGCLHATANICTHQLAYLSEGYLEGEYIECPQHQSRFNVVTGVPDGPPADKPVRVFPIRIENGAVMVDLGDEAGALPSG